jgi:hypothetical protein
MDVILREYLGRREMKWREVRENCTMGSFITCTLQDEKGEMGGACSTNGGEEECIKDIGGKARRKETTGKT